MLATSASRPAILSETMRRVRLEKESVNRNWPARLSQPSGRIHGLTGVSETAPSMPSDVDPSSAFTPGSSCVRSSKGNTAFEMATAASYPRRRQPHPTPSRRRGQALTALSDFLETVTDAIKRLNHLEIVIDDLEFLAQPLDVAVDGAVIDIDLIVIRGIHQRIAAFHNARAGRQRLQDQELGHGQRHRLVLPGTGVALRIHTQQAAVECLGVVLLRHGRRVLWLRTAQHGLDALDQEPLRKRLADEIVGAHLEAEQFVDFLVLGGEKDHRQVGFLPETS